MEIARASCERLLDTRASAEMARRLLALQRRLVESQVVDRRTRRVLHDDVLPQVQAALLALRPAVALATGGEGQSEQEADADAGALWQTSIARSLICCATRRRPLRVM